MRSRKHEKEKKLNAFQKGTQNWRILLADLYIARQKVVSSKIRRKTGTLDLQTNHSTLSYWDGGIW